MSSATAKKRKKQCTGGALKTEICQVDVVALLIYLLRRKKSHVYIIQCCPPFKITNKMNDSKTQRGFEITEFEDTYGAKCSLQMSSSAMEDKIWFGVNDADPKIMVSKAKEHGLEPQGENGWMTYPIPDDVLLNTRMHLNRKQVEELLPYLKRFVETGSLHE